MWYWHNSSCLKLEGCVLWNPSFRGPYLKATHKIKLLTNTRSPLYSGFSKPWCPSSTHNWKRQLLWNMEAPGKKTTSLHISGPRSEGQRESGPLLWSSAALPVQHWDGTLLQHVEELVKGKHGSNFLLLIHVN